MTAHQYDLVILAPDKNVEATVVGILNRHFALGMRRISFRVFVHPQRDPGCLLRGASFLRSLTNQYQHALVLFDLHGCGRETERSEQLESEVNTGLRSSGWNDRAVSIVINPELETWVWADSPHVAKCLGWGQGQRRLRAWLESSGAWPRSMPKPIDPKTALLNALRESGRARSSSIYRCIAESVSFESCTDDSFNRLRAILRAWFPAAPTTTAVH